MPGDLALTVALVQWTATPATPAANLTRGLAAVETAARAGADVVLFPELWQVAYAPGPPGAGAPWSGLAIGDDDPWLESFRDAARRHAVAVVVTYLQRWPGAPRNAATVVDRRGRDVLTYAKVHTCDFNPAEAAFTPGDAFPVADLDTAAGTVRVGVMICYDREFPESARELMLGGAELILTPNACELTDDRVGQFRARAFENMVAVAMANYPAPRWNGRSCAFDGMVAAEPDGPARDHRVAEAGPGEELVLARFDLDALRTYRRAETWGDAYRRPGAYPLLAAGGAARPPFVRPDARRRGPAPGP